MKTNRIVCEGIICVLVGLWLKNTCVAGDIVTREMYFKDGVGVVDDKLHVDEQFAQTEPEVWVLFRASQSGTNLLKEIQGLLAGENIEVKKYEFKHIKDYLDLHVVSVIKFADTNKTASLRWLPTWGGETADFHEVNISLGRRGAEMCLFHDGGKSILWFPDLGPAKDELDEFEMFKAAYKFAAPFDFQFESTLDVGDHKVTLFSRNVNKAPEMPDLALLNLMNQAHSMSVNDLVGMCTSTKIAKGGYYEIHSISAKK